MFFLLIVYRRRRILIIWLILFIRVQIVKRLAIYSRRSRLLYLSWMKLRLKSFLLFNKASNTNSLILQMKRKCIYLYNNIKLPFTRTWTHGLFSNLRQLLEKLLLSFVIKKRKKMLKNSLNTNKLQTQVT